ncbi:hypothetical protein ACG04R_09990 [Roseateles sp. BYS78W]|uniref:Carboxypeptidase regulatory-like domain-containing protein n=1 Tax=Pelomonas candidula TaxID=3299025 RepID=A0ABW7HAQ7_9BURK
MTLAAVAAATLAACGGGGGGSTTSTTSSAPATSTASTSTYLDGTAAYGAPLAQAKVTITDVNGKTVTVTASDAGSYKADVTGLKAPLLVTATAASGDAVRVYHALLASDITAGSTGHANVTQLTDAIVSLASSDGSTPGEFASADKLKSLDPARLQKAQDLVKTIVKDVATALGATGYDPVTATFTADGTSSADKLLDMVKLTIDQSGVTLRIVGVSASTSADGAASSTVATVKDATAAAPAALPAPTVTDGITAFDPWVASVNKCLALPAAQRVSTDTSGAPTAFLGDCAKISGFTANYLHNGYTLLQYWGKQLHNVIPDGAVMGRPEVLGFFKTDAGDDTAIVRFTYSSPKGGGSYVDTAHKLSGVWALEGNQRKYDAGISIRMARSTDLSTNPFTPANGPDAGKNVGWFNAYSPRIHLTFNQSGPNGAAVYAVRVKGPGLPANGIVLARSSSCGTGDYLATYSNDGTLPTTPAAGTTVMPLPTSATSNRYTLGVAQNGSAYTGTDFYNEWRGRNADGTPSTSRSNMIAPSPGVDLSTIPLLARYVFEVFKAGSSTPADTFAVRAVTKPVSAAFAAKLPWAEPTANALEYVKPTNTALAAALDSAALSWTVPADGAPVGTAYLYGTGYDGSIARRMQADTSVAALGDTSLTVQATAERDGNGQTCGYAKIPSFTATSGSREIGLRQPMVDGLVMQTVTQHLARSPAK